MDQIVKSKRSFVPTCEQLERLSGGPEISREQAIEAVRTLLMWAGEDPEREGLRDTPERVVRAYGEYFAGYKADPYKELSRTFEEVKGYDDIILLRDIGFQSHCEHHIAPIIGTASVAYLAGDKVVGISKLARVVEIFSRRLQTQEVMTDEIGACINIALQPRGVAVVVSAEHHCMTSRGVRKSGVMTVTRHLSGVFADDPLYRAELMQLLRVG